MCLGIPGRIVEISEDAGLRMGTVDFGGVRREVCLAYLDEDISIGDYAIVHVGFAIEKVDKQRADEIWEALEEVLAMMDEEDERARSINSPGDG